MANERQLNILRQSHPEFFDTVLGSNPSLKILPPFMIENALLEYERKMNRGQKLRLKKQPKVDTISEITNENTPSTGTKNKPGRSMFQDEIEKNQS